MAGEKQAIIDKLRQDILTLEGFKPAAAGESAHFGLGPLEAAFPNKVFPTGAIHEFISGRPVETAACGGVIAGIIRVLLEKGGICVWVSFARRIYPPALKRFGLNPDRVIFVDVPLQRDVLWVMEEALKCPGVAAVVCETHDLSFMESRRLQLAVEQSHVTGFVLRKDVKKENTTACVSRWCVRPVRSQLRTGMPGVGLPRWQVDLTKIRNGSPGTWTLEWFQHQFRTVTPFAAPEKLHRYA
jgi:protein ImuA